LHDTLIHWAALREPIGGVRLPVVGVDLTPAFVVSMLILGIGVIVVHRWLRRPRIADLLIETEAELLKVTWPKGSEVWNASMVVLVSVVLLGLYLAGVDIFLFRLMRALILGDP
jgi:preprotein translocase SecE subunit